MVNNRLLARALRFLFYVCLDVAVGAVIYVISVGEAGLASGQLAIRILTAMALASAIVGGPDIMLYWQESGRRIAAEEERDTERDGRIAAEQERDAAEQERDAAVANMAAMAQRVDELSTQVAQLQNARTSRRSRRRHLRRNGS